MIVLKINKNPKGLEILKDFLSFIKLPSQEIKTSCEGARPMYKIVLSDKITKVQKDIWNHFIKETEKKLKETYKGEDLLLKETNGVLYWNRSQTQINLYFIYKIHTNIIDDYLKNNQDEAIFKNFAPENGYGCY